MSENMQVIHSIHELRAQRAQWQTSNTSVAFVPTMGNLHEGHLSLVQHGRACSKRVIVSIFVNRMQFGVNEDFDRYPRTLVHDLALLKKANVDVVFIPDEQALYPESLQQHTIIDIPAYSDDLCGISRPQHFIGVCTIVTKLFHLVQPDVAIFGEKDFQQLFIIKKMVKDLFFSIQIVAGHIIRETDGLAYSSRNQYLSASERVIAPQLYRQLQETSQHIKTGMKNFVQLCQQAITQLEKHGFVVDYYTVRDANTLAVANDASRDLIILVAAYLGKTRLIDNLRI